MRLFDMHCHLGLMANGEDVAQQAKSCELTLLDTGVLPSEFETEQRRHASNDSVYVACGLHPWWVTDTLKDSEIEQLIERARSYPLIGEVGLDFSNAHAQYAARQIRVFERLVSACSANKVEGRLLSIHAVQSASNVLRHSGGQRYLPTGQCHLPLVFWHGRGPHASAQARLLFLNQ